MSCAAEEPVDEAGGHALWTRIQSMSYGSWAPAPGWDEPRPTVGAHGRSAVIFMNPLTAAALSGPALEAWPEGTLVVKDSYDGTRLELVAAMEKQAGRWYYAEWSSTGNVLYAGQPSVCTGCHVADNDRLRAVKLPQ
jgi:hypothetical protein